jgi:hypothetical protein
MNRVPQFLLSIGRVTTPWARVLYTGRYVSANPIHLIDI